MWRGVAGPPTTTVISVSVPSEAILTSRISAGEAAATAAATAKMAREIIRLSPAHASPAASPDG